MKLTVCDLDGLSKHCAKHNPTHILSLVDKDMTVNYPPGVATKRFDMYDLEFEDPKMIGVPTREQVREIIEYARSLDAVNDTVVVHCWAGISRSTAAALIILYVHLGDIKRAVNKLLEIRPQAAPNKLICRYADEILNERNPILLRAALEIEDRYLNWKGYVIE